VYYPDEVRELLESEGRNRTFVAFANPLEREVVTASIEGVWRREGVKLTFSETPEKSVSLEIERSAFPVSFRPSLRPPSDVQTGVISSVLDGVGAVGLSEVKDRFLCEV
jgi:hypothetical protein